MAEIHEFRFHRVVDMKGSFAFGDSSFLFSSLGQKQHVNYVDVSHVSRVYYERMKSAAVVSLAQANPNKYRIELADGSALEFCVAHAEEDAYTKALEKLRRKIYGGNPLGVGFSAKARAVPAQTRREQDRQFAKERPPSGYSLEKAMAAMLRHCGLELDDQTKYESPKEKKAHKSHPPVRDENIFVELAKLISNNDEAVVSQVFSRVECWEEYAETVGGKHEIGKRKLSAEDIHWIAIADTLKQHGYAEKVNWNENHARIAPALERIKSKLAVTLDTAPALDMLGGDEFSALKPARVLSLIGMTLSAQRWTVCTIDMEADAYTLCLLPHKAFRQCAKLLDGTKFSITPY